MASALILAIAAELSVVKILPDPMPSTSDTSAIQIGSLPFDGDNNKIQTFGTPFNNLNIDLVPYVQNSAIFIGKSDNF